MTSLESPPPTAAVPRAADLTPHLAGKAVFGFAGYSGSGKTTLIEQLIPRLIGRGLRVSLIKHAHHDFDIDKPGKDSYRHRQAGAAEVLITCNSRYVLLHELRGAPEPTLAEHLAHLSACDLVLVEGFKNDPIPKIEIHRPAHGRPLIYPENPYVVAVASDADLALPPPLSRLDLNDPDAVADFIVAYVRA
jgi:molybdopterin-guanine dinucleotide biosynthesis protein B